MLVKGDRGGTVKQQVGVDLQTRASLTPGQLRQLAEAGLRIEKYFRQPQDIEFAFDDTGELVILQSRPLNISRDQVCRPADLAAVTSRYPVLLAGRGDIAHQGIAAGVVRIVRSEKDLKDFPDGAILVASYASPLYARVMPRAAGIITDVGAATGHLATVAREFRLPAIFNCGEATRILADGQEITMDAEENIVYQGIIPELRLYGQAGEPIDETREYRLLRRVLRKIQPLHLIDPAESNFTPGACRTLHDITRFVHEKAVEALIDFNYDNRHAPENVVGRLAWQIPLDLLIIDIGGGLRPGVRGRIKPADVLSSPMRAILEGIDLPGAWNNEPMSVDFGSFMSSLTRTMAPELARPRHLGQNLAVISGEYANISLRLGYHFTMIDAYVSDVVNDNSIYFRFFGGVTDDSRRARRARFLGEILAVNDFRVELHGDLVVGRIKKLDRQRMLDRLVALGLLIGFTRQLDVLMVSDQRIYEYIERFNALLEEYHEQKDKHPDPGR